MKLAVEVQGLNELVADAERQGADAKKLMKGAITNSVNRIQSNTRALAPHRTGTLQRSIMVQVDYPVGQVSVEEKYGKFVEEGTGIYNGGSRIMPKGKVLAWQGPAGMIFARSTKGMKARPFFKPGIEQSVDYIAEQFIKVLDKLTHGLAGH